MLKGAHKTRWERRKEPAFDDWVIEEANWLTMDESIVAPPGGFDAGVILGNSFAHLPDFHGDMRDHKKCMENFVKLIKPGGIFVIDHRSVGILGTVRICRLLPEHIPVRPNYD